MWKLLYQLASPKIFYDVMAKLVPLFKWSALILLGIAITWGLGFAPADYQQSDAFRIIYVHVPSAFLSVGLFAWMGFLAILLLVWRIKVAGIMLINIARVGAAFTFLALITGSIWGKPMWGAWWVWDARLTSELILLVMYVAILAVHQSIRQIDSADRLAAILALVGLLDLPIIHYSVYWWNTLHQGATLTILSKPKMDGSMLYPLLISLIGFSLFALWIITVRAKEDVLWREKRQSWVHKLLEGCS